MTGTDSPGEDRQSEDRYASVGVDYSTLDRAKREAIAAAASTSASVSLRAGNVLPGSRGEPAAVIALGDLRLGFVLECLGTKSLIAATYEEQAGVDRYFDVGYDTVASAVNDCCCVGALPIVVNAYFATGSASFYDGSRHSSLVAGWAAACRDAGAEWGGGESPTLSGLITPGAIDLAAAVVGLVPAGTEPMLGEALCSGDEIVLVASSGLHQNGASLARSLAGELADGFLSVLPSGRGFAEAVLDKSVIYTSLVAALLAEGQSLHYASHITGHGLRKLMRADRELTYRITVLPEVPEVLRFLVRGLSFSPREAYGTFNMGAGFALYLAQGAGRRAVELATELGYEAIVGGVVEAGPRSVVLEPLGLTYGREELDLH